ncbi:MAG: hypothetical protein L0H64_01230 [Pseudonocardia sp.]|nr:hypothetical protein [Pseudonocardia sp.]
MTRSPRERTAGYGVTVMTYGAARYHAQAADLTRSLRLHSPSLALAVVTDRPTDPLLDTLFDHVVPLPPGVPADGRAKLDLDLHSPFERTLYLDSDSLVFRDVSFVLERYRGREIVVLGRQISEGHWYGDVPALCRLAGSSSIPQFNGGVLYFADTPVTRAVFGFARELASRYGELGLDRFNGGIADEPLLAVALARHGIMADPRDGDTSVSLLGLQGEPELDVAGGHASFVKNGRHVAPAVVHFAAQYAEPDAPEGRYYRTARAALRQW